LLVYNPLLKKKVQAQEKFACAREVRQVEGNGERKKGPWEKVPGTVPWGGKHSAGGFRAFQQIFSGGEFVTKVSFDLQGPSNSSQKKKKKDDLGKGPAIVAEGKGFEGDASAKKVSVLVRLQRGKTH